MASAQQKHVLNYSHVRNAVAGVWMVEKRTTAEMVPESRECSGMRERGGGAGRVVS